MLGAGLKRQGEIKSGLREKINHTWTWFWLPGRDLKVHETEQGDCIASISTKAVGTMYTYNQPSSSNTNNSSAGDLKSQGWGFQRLIDSFPGKSLVLMDESLA